MKNIINSYKDISEKILKLLEAVEIDNDKIDKYLEERQALLEIINKENIDIFRKEYKANLSDIDIQIKELLQKKLDNSKRELAQYRKNQNGNIAYTNMNKTKLNIFYKKV